MYQKIIFILISIILFNEPLSANIKISATVNNEIITNYDIERESNYLKILNPKLIQLNKDQILSLAKKSLINEIIKKKEIEKFEYKEINKELINSQIQRIYMNLGFNNENNFIIKLEEIDTYTLSEIKKKIEIEFLWNQLIYSKYINQIKINKDKIEEKIDKLKNNKNKEYTLSEIVFTKKRGASLESLIDEINLSIKEIGFNNTANIYSISDSSKLGGKIGQIEEINLNDEIKNKLTNLSKGNITNPIKINNTYVILKIEDIKNIKKKFNREEEIERLINSKINEKLNNFANLYFNKTKLNYFINDK